MKFEEPKESFVWPPIAMLSHVHLGPKCFMRLIHTEDGIWWEMGGRRIEEHESNAGDSPEVDASNGYEYEDKVETLNDYLYFHLLGEEFTVDKRQTRIYYRFNTRTQEHECRIMLPKDFHFRSRRKGKKLEDSRSFMEDGMPHPEVLLLYALKTQDLMDRRIAVEAFDQKVWGAHDLDQLFRSMDQASMNHQNFCDFAGSQLSLAATRSGGLADWAIWEKVADAAFAEKKDIVSHLENSKNQSTHVKFLRALEDAVIEHRGMPAKVHVRRKCGWDDNDAWKDLLKTMGMTWLPGEPEWNKFHKHLKVDQRQHEDQPHDKIDRRKAKSPKPRR